MKDSKWIAKMKRERFTVDHDWYVKARLLERFGVMSFDDALDLREREFHAPRRPKPTSDDLVFAALTGSGLSKEALRGMYQEYSREHAALAKEIG